LKNAIWVLEKSLKSALILYFEFAMNCWQQLMLGLPVRQVRLVFHNDDQSSHSLAVDGRTTVAQVCDQLVQCNHAVHSPHWTVVERLQRYQLGQFHLLL